MLTRRISEAKNAYLSEIKREKRTKFYLRLFTFIFIISLTLLSYSYLSTFSSFTGFVSYLSTSAGYITQVNVHNTFAVNEWAGFYGLALTVPGLTDQFSEALQSGTIERFDVFFNCIQQDVSGGPEIYASTSSSLDFSSVTGANLGAIDTFIGCSGEVYCANETFTRNTSVMVGSTNVTDVPTTSTYRYDGNNSIFEMGALNISGNLAFFTKVSAIQKGYSPNVTINFQLLLPTPANTSQTYYFFSDPNDQCPSGGLGTSINASMHGYVFNSAGNYLSNASVNVAGYASSTNSSGFYNVSFLVLAGTYNAIAQKDSYQTAISNVTVNFTSTSVNKNFTLEALSSTNFISVSLSGTVKSNSGSAISGATIAFGNASATSSSSGVYSLNTTLSIGPQPLVAYKTGYDNYYTYINISSANTTLQQDITLLLANANTFATGPYTENKDGENIEKIKQLAKELGQDYWISTQDVKVQVRKNTFIEQRIKIYNFGEKSMNAVFFLSESLKDFVDIDKSSITISPDTSGELVVTIFGTKPVGIYEGVLRIVGVGESEQSIPFNIEIIDRKLPIETMFLNLDLLKDSHAPGSNVKYKISMQNLLIDESYKIILETEVIDEKEEVFATADVEEVELDNSLNLIRKIKLPDDLPEGKYSIRVRAKFLNLLQTVEEPLNIVLPFYLYAFFGIPLWLILTIISSLSFVLFNLFLYKHHIEKKKRYKLNLNPSLLPHEGVRSIKLGKIAETNLWAHYDLDMLTTHAIIAGATGGGKSIAAQVFIEEALLKGISVIVFDPTAQWSGMLRKCEDKRMLSLYPKFGLKESDAKAFPGNVRQIQNARQIIEIEKYMQPGHIQIFTMNKLDPAGIDLFVSGVISSIFKSDPKEHPGLKTILVFDEVHRLLPKFGGQGRGFLQIERACREFRKWGLGVMLVSQVLSDFVGEIKANINTEVQMRVAEESDLNRIKERYGLEALKSLVRADIGVGMVQNAEYNRGLPYFIGFRPILHNTRRLSDEILEKYNKYGEIIEDIEYQIEQMEEFKVDTFDLKMELKLVKEKLMTGNFTVVDIYLEGLQPRLAKQWEKLGKKPKKKELLLLSETDIASSLQAAQKERDKWDKTVKSAVAPSAQAAPQALDPAKKIVSPIILDNGMMISSLGELKDVIPNLDPSMLKALVSGDKNQLMIWAEKEISPDLAKNLNGKKTKEEILNTIKEFTAPKEEIKPAPAKVDDKG